MASVSLTCGKRTTGEAKFYIGGSYGRRRVCYVRSTKTDFKKLKFVKRDSFAPGFMVWAQTLVIIARPR